jgi:hypothetical protein
MIVRECEHGNPFTQEFDHFRIVPDLVAAVNHRVVKRFRQLVNLCASPRPV